MERVGTRAHSLGSGSRRNDAAQARKLGHRACEAEPLVVPLRPHELRRDARRAARQLPPLTLRLDPRRNAPHSRDAQEDVHSLESRVAATAPSAATAAISVLSTNAPSDADENPC